MFSSVIEPEEPGIVLRTVAWMYDPVRSEPGMLELRQGELAFVSSDGTDVFRASSSEVTASFPRWARHLNFTLRVRGRKFRVCLARPTNAADAQINRADQIGVLAALASGGVTSVGSPQFETWPEGARNGRAWKAALTAELDRSRG
jgi:hypothetical protein